MDAWVYVVLLGIAVMVLAMIRGRGDGKPGGASIVEFEEALDRFADVMDEDNRQLLETVQGWRRDLEADINRLRGRVDALERQLSRADAATPAAPPEPEAASGEASQKMPNRPAGPATDEPAASSAGDPDRRGAGETERPAEPAMRPDGRLERRPSGGSLPADASPPSAAGAARDADAGDGPGGGDEARAVPVPGRGIRSRYPELFAWHDAGKSVEYIAKKTGMNKGEVMLILQLAKREEQHRA